MQNPYMFLIAVLLGVMPAGCKKAATAVKEVQQAPVQYVNSLQNDVRKAEQVKNIANQKIQQDAQELDKNLKEAAGADLSGQ